MSGAGLFLVALFGATARLAAPLILAALAGLYAERAGVVDIGLEGKLLFGAFAGAAAAALSGSAAAGLTAAIAAGMLLSLLHGWAGVALGGDQIVSGMALNLFAAGAAPSLASAWFHQGGATPPLGPGARFAPIPLPFAGALQRVPVLGPIYHDVLSGQSLPVYLAWLAVPATAFILARTRWGLRLRAVGESPEAIAAAGISVKGLRWGALALGGALCGIGGAALSMAMGNGFLRGMSAGRGYLALAALIFGKWRPWPVLAACLFFAAADALATRLEGLAVPGLGALPVELIEALPYVVTVAVLAGFAGAARPPRALGKPYPPVR